MGQALFKRTEELLKARDYWKEECATAMQRGFEAELTLVIDTAFPMQVWLNACAESAESMQYARIQLHEEILSGAEKAIRDQPVDISIASSVPQGFMGDQIPSTEFVAVASPTHPLTQTAVPSNSKCCACI